MYTDAIAWTDTGAVRLLDQTRLPHETAYCELDTIDGMVEAIATLRVRGAPLIGVAGAMGLAAAARRALDATTPMADADAWLRDATERLAAARPTAVNLRWAVERVRDRVAGVAVVDLADRLRREAQTLWDEDAAMCRAIGEAGAALFPDGATIMTHCNTGMLATGGIGTALGVIRVVHEASRLRRVYACEARPLRQGSRLTAWECARLGIPCTVIVDSAAAMVLADRGIDGVIVGADRIAANGDTANKVGTRNLATLAAAADVPFYVAAPASTFDLEAATGAAIPIEERSGDEIDVAAGVEVYNPAFDVTPAALITAIVTDGGVVRPPYAASVPRALGVAGVES